MVVMRMIIGRFAHVAQLLKDIAAPSADMRWCTSVTRTRAIKCRMSVEAALLRVGAAVALAAGGFMVFAVTARRCPLHA